MGSASEEVDFVEERTDHITPLPKLQLTIVAVIFLAEPINANVISPFVNEMLNEYGITHGDPRKTGYYVGLISSLFYLTECLMILQWGRLSDRIGRKPVLLVGIFGVTISMVCFGLSKTFWPLVLSRALAGALNGNIGVVKTVLGEISNDSNRAQAFAIIPMCWPAGIAIGSLIGGFFSDPAKRFPRQFSSQFWRDYPYFLPCFIVAMFSIFNFLLILFLLKETRVVHYQEPKMSSTQRQSILHEPGPEDPLLTPPGIPLHSKKPLSLSSIITPRVRDAVLNYSFLTLLDISFITLQPLVYSAPVDAGGLGFNPAMIGATICAFGLVDGGFEMAFFAWLCRKVGMRRLFAISVLSMAGGFLAFPVMNLFARTTALMPLVWVVVGVQFVTFTMSGMAYSCSNLFVGASSPATATLGTVNGLAQTMTSFMRAVGPASTTVSFAFSIEKNLLGGNLVYVILTLLTIVAFGTVHLLPDEPWPRDEEV